MTDRDALAGRLARLAAAGETVTYGALAAELGLRIGALTALLEALMEEDASAGAPQRAALLMGKLSGGLPARGFFDKAAELGLTIDDPAIYVAETRAQLARQHG